MQSLLQTLRNLFTADRKEQILLAGVAGVGVLLAIIALLLFSGGDGDDNTAADDDPANSTATANDEGTASATSTRTATATSEPTSSVTETPTEDPSATETEDPDATETPAGGSNQGSDGSGSNPATATSAPAATATPVPPSSNLAYCNTGGSGNPPAGSVIGLVTIAGVVAPAGTIVQLVFDGALGPSEAVTVEDGKAGYSLNYSSGGADCANQAGAAISVIVNGQSFATGRTVGGGEPAFLFSVDLN